MKNPVSRSKIMHELSEHITDLEDEIRYTRAMLSQIFMTDRGTVEETRAEVERLYNLWLEKKKKLVK